MRRGVSQVFLNAESDFGVNQAEFHSNRSD